METRKSTPVEGKKPERDFFARLKGRPVTIFLLGEDELMRGTLLWIDRFSLGIGVSQKGSAKEEELMLYKHAILGIKEGS